MKSFWDRVTNAEQCWLWTGCTNGAGYGALSFRGKSMGAHRAALESLGIDTTGRYVLHRCDNKLCCNPAHLFLGTQRENIADMNAKGRGNHHLKVHHGSAHGRAKLTEADVLAIRRRARDRAPGPIPKTDPTSTANLAREYGVSPSVVYQIISRRTWAHV